MTDEEYFKLNPQDDSPSGKLNPGSVVERFDFIKPEIAEGLLTEARALMPDAEDEHVIDFLEQQKHKNPETPEDYYKVPTDKPKIESAINAAKAKGIPAGRGVLGTIMSGLLMATGGGSVKDVQQVFAAEDQRKMAGRKEAREQELYDRGTAAHEKQMTYEEAIADPESDISKQAVEIARFKLKGLPGIAARITPGMSAKAVSRIVNAFAPEMAAQLENTMKLAYEESSPLIKEKREAKEKDRASVIKAARIKATGAVTAAGIKAKAAISKEEKKKTIDVNIDRFESLNESKTARDSGIKKAKEFLERIESGKQASGALRKSLEYVPGVYTEQGQWDEEFNAFAEIAARQALKASGEIRPTDADVTGMKKAMFGVGRDEKTNVKLLTDYIADQERESAEYDAMVAGKTSGVYSEELVTADEDMVPPVNEVTRMVNGRAAIFNADTKTFIRWK